MTFNVRYIGRQRGTLEIIVSCEDRNEAMHVIENVTRKKRDGDLRKEDAVADALYATLRAIGRKDPIVERTGPKEVTIQYRRPHPAMK